jgi:hypothetical protein
MNEYFRSKLHQSDILLNPNPAVVECEVTGRNLAHLDKFVTEKTAQHGPCGWDKKGKVYRKIKDLNENKQCTKMSLQSRLVSGEYEFSTKVLQNSASACSRQLSGRVVPCLRQMRKFKTMSKLLWTHYLKTLDFGAIKDVDFIKYPEKFPAGKRDIYLKQILLQLSGKKRIPKTWCGKAMVKGGEVYVDATKVPSTEFDPTSNRPRLVCSPYWVTLGLPQAISSIVQKHLKVIESFVCGLNLVELAEQVQKYEHLTRVISLDGSAYDSNQSAEMQRLVQGPLWDEVCKYLELWLAANGAKESIRTADELKNHFHSYENHLYFYIPQIDAEWTDEQKRSFALPEKEMINHLPLTLTGTTFSGHSFRTTIGNTLNNIFQTYYYI